ncbi:MAG: hypothetical protein WCF84_23230 [Anaerolineae bacterium]
MDTTPTHIEYALEPLNFLNDALPTGGDTYQEAIRSCREQKLKESLQYCSQLDQLGLELGNSYIQGLAQICSGSVRFALDARHGGWEHAIEALQQSQQKFHTQADKPCEHNEGVAWLALGRVYEKQCIELGMNRWEKAIEAFEHARSAFLGKNMALYASADRAMHHVAEAQASTHHQQQVPDPQPASPSPAPQPASQQKDHKAKSRFWFIKAPFRGMSRMVRRMPRVLSYIKHARRLSTLTRNFHRLWDALSFKRIFIIEAAFLVILVILLFLFREYPSWDFGFALGIAGCLLVTGIDFLLIEQAGRLLFFNSNKAAAVVVYRGRVWAETKPGLHLLHPNAEHLEAFITLNPRESIRLLQDLAQGGLSFKASLKTNYAIVDAARVWTEISTSIEHPKLLGINKPVPAKMTLEPVAQYAEKRIERIVCDALAELAADASQRHTLGETADLNRHIGKLLREQSDTTGIRFYHLSIEILQPYTPLSPLQ